MCRLQLFFLLAIVMLGQKAIGNDLFNRDEYSSGFKPASHCDELMVSAVERLSAPMKTFKDLPLDDKIKAVHTLSHAAVRLSDDQLRSLANYLRIVSESSAKKLAEHSDELLVIGVEIGDYLDKDDFPEGAVAGFISFLDDVVSLPRDDTQISLMAKAAVHANLAHARIIQLKFVTGRQKGKVLDEATKEIANTTQLGAQAAGYVGMKWLNLDLMIIKTVIQQYDSFDENLKPSVRGWLSEMIEPAIFQPEEMFLKAGEPLPKSTADLIADIYEMPETKRFPKVYDRCAGFFRLLQQLIRNKTN
jgi:hypothetical protein